MGPFLGISLSELGLLSNGILNECLHEGRNTWSGTGYFPSFPATSPWVVAVGATMGPNTNGPEIACQSQLGGVITTGGGFSTYFATPSWQAKAVSGYFNQFQV